jgi:hypothetical protein
LPKLKKVFKVIVVSFMLFISFEVLKPNKVNAEIPITPELAQFIEIKNYFRDSGFTYELHQHDPRVLLNTQRGNCVAFAMLFQEKATRYGLTCITMCSPDHAYNLVRIDGQWYFVDLCNYAANYTENFIHIYQIHPTMDRREIIRFLDKHFCKFCLLFSYDKARENLGKTTCRFFLPGCFCNFQENGVLYERNISAPQNSWLCRNCTRDFDWDDLFNPTTSESPTVDTPSAILDDDIVNVLTTDTELIIMANPTPQPTYIPPTPKRVPTYRPAPNFVVAPTQSDDNLLPIHRVYNGKVHHYTSNFGEVQCLMDLGWTYEQPAFECFQSYKEGRFEVFRLYNPNDPFGNHLLTINEHEKNQLIKLGWRLEESNGYVEINHNMKRIYNRGTGEHFYTTSNEEVQNALNAGWLLDGIVW